MNWVLPQDAYNEARRLSCTARARKILIDRLNNKIGQDDYIDWHNNYFLPTLISINDKYGEAVKDAREGNYPNEHRPTWSDASPSTNWNGSNIILPNGLQQSNKGSMRSFLIRLENKLQFNNIDEEAIAFGDICRLAEEECEQDIFWDNKITWEVGF